MKISIHSALVLFAVRLLISAFTATRFFDRSAPDLCLVDVQLPRKNGFELVREMKSRGTATPILLMSAVYTDQDASTRTVQLGTLADGYLTKPFDLVQLLAQVRQLLGEA